jgi:D-lactate dehydrogenase
MKIAFFSSKAYDKEFFDLNILSKKHQISYFDMLLNKDTANFTKGFDAICAFVNDKIDGDTIEILTENGIKLIVLRCAGFNNIDVNAAIKNNIKIFRVPAYSPEAVAEHAVALILTLNRKTHKAYNRIRENNFSLEKLTGFNLFEKTVGVIGTGKTGAAFCKIMLGFGCQVVAFDIQENESLKQLGVTYILFDELLKNADVISIHCPLNPQTQHLINDVAFAKMKDGVMLINTSRGAIVDTKKAITALKSKKLGYLGIDVYEQEENLFFKDLSESIIQDDVISRLMSFPNVLITAHQGFFTKEALAQIANITLHNVDDFVNGISSENEVK